MEPIDIVLPWVDDTDPQWIEEREKYMDSYFESRKNLAHYFRDWDTLRYVFRSLEKNMPWVRYIHFITCGHLPAWLNTNHPKLKIHSHKEFFSSNSTLPIFSANPIEMNMHNIPELAEKFIYFNDDTLAVSEVKPERFYRDNQVIDYLVLDIPRYGWLYDHLRIKDVYGYLCKNDIETIGSKYSLNKLAKEKPQFFFDKSYSLNDRLKNRLFTTVGMYKWIKINHNPQAFLLSNVKDCVAEFRNVVEETCCHRFRSAEDVNQYLFRFYNLFRGDFIPHYFDDDFCIVLASEKRYKKERENLFTKTFVCFNDSPFLKAEEYPALKKIVDRDLNNVFPGKSDFEI